jgi:hypothetical protein
LNFPSGEVLASAHLRPERFNIIKLRQPMIYITYVLLWRGKRNGKKYTSIKKNNILPK